MILREISPKFHHNSHPSSIITWAFQHTSALAISIWTPVESLLGVMMAIFFLGEEITIRVMIGGPLVLVGVVAVLYDQQREKSEL